VPACERVAGVCGADRRAGAAVFFAPCAACPPRGAGSAGKVLGSRAHGPARLWRTFDDVLEQDERADELCRAQRSIREAAAGAWAVCGGEHLFVR